MEGPPNAPTTRSRIPRSKLPLPKAGGGVRPSLSRDSLRTPNGALTTRLRNTQSRDQLSSTRDRDSSIGTVVSSYSKLQTQGENRRLSGFQKVPGLSAIDKQDHISIQTENGTPRKAYHSVASTDSAEDEVMSENARQSLSERTMETLSQIPPSPAVRRRTSSFFNPDSPMRPPSRTTNCSRPGSSYQLDSSMPPPVRTTGSRPGSSAGNKVDVVPIDFRASTNTFRAPKSSIISETRVKNPPAIKTIKTPLKAKSSTNLRSNMTPSGLPPQGPGSKVNEKSPITAKKPSKPTPITPSRNTIATRALKPRASVGSLFRKPSMPELDRESERIGPGTKRIPSSKSPNPRFLVSESPPKPESGNVGIADLPDTPRKSSLALREHIAKAKAVKRAQAERKSSGTTMNNSYSTEEIPVIPAGTFDFGLSDDPFNQLVGSEGGKGLLRKRIDAARTDGRLNIAAMGLKEIPSEVMDMYNFDAVNNQGGSWAESVDLTRFIAAGNELEFLGDDVFPDVDPRELQDEDESKGNQFGGLETLDLHGNLLKVLPLGLRRLNILTTLNLSNNKLGNDSFDVISQISSLRDLKIGDNNLTGELSPDIAKLHNLEVLDVQKNSLNSLPDGLAELVRLRVLNISENAFTSLPFEILRRLPLIELSAMKNKLDGTLIALHDVEMSQLQILNVAVNALTSLASKELRLPSLHQLNCSANRLTSLPDLSSWKSLLTLTAEDNNISVIPNGFIALTTLKNVDLTGNNLKVLDDHIGRMDSLAIFRISGNPLREKKFASMPTDDLKRALSARLAPPPDAEVAVEESSEVYTSCPSSPTTATSSSEWPIKPGGVLDRSKTHSDSLDPSLAAQVAASNIVRTLDLRHNSFIEIPAAVEVFATALTTLIVSHNSLAGDAFLSQKLSLPHLQTLTLSTNALTSLAPLHANLHAPALHTLDLSANRLSSLLPPLSQSFPSLRVLLASHNSITELAPDAIRGLSVVDCSSNDLGALDARLGLLKGLERLNVMGNRFRVPRYTVLEKGTGALMEWLRGRIPAEEEGGEDGNGWEGEGVD